MGQKEPRVPPHPIPRLTDPPLPLTEHWLKENNYQEEIQDSDHRSLNQAKLCDCPSNAHEGGHA